MGIKKLRKGYNKLHLGYKKLSEGHDRIYESRGYEKLCDVLSCIPLLASTKKIGEGEKIIIRTLHDGRKKHRELELRYKEGGFDSSLLPPNIYQLIEKGYVKIEDNVGLPFYSLTFSGKIAARKLERG